MEHSLPHPPLASHYKPSGDRFPIKAATTGVCDHPDADIAVGWTRPWRLRPPPRWEGNNNNPPGTPSCHT
eukprot:scaffold12284_cov166-Skeletonema_marinoi.AAC.3